MPNGESKNIKRHQLYAFCTVNILSLLHGIPDYPSTLFYVSTLNTIGYATFAFIWGFVANKFGRKISAYLIIVTLIVGWLVSSKVLDSGFLAEFTWGASNGGIIINNVLFLSEIFAIKQRARVLSSIWFCNNVIAFGMLFVMTVTGMQIFVSRHGAVLVLLPVFMVCAFMFYWLPESPVHLMRKKRVAEAAYSAAWYGMLLESNELPSESYVGCAKGSLKVIFSATYTKPLIVLVVLSLTQRLIGVLFILESSVNIYFQIDWEVIIVIVSILIAATSGVLCIVIDAIPRKVFLLVPYTTLIFSLLITILDLYLTPQNYAFVLLHTFAIIASFVLFNSCILLTPFFLFTEMFPSYVLSYVLSIHLFLAGLSQVVLNFTVDYLESTPRFRIPLCMFCILVNVCVVLVILKFFKESKTKEGLPKGDAEITVLEAL